MYLLRKSSGAVVWKFCAKKIHRPVISFLSQATCHIFGHHVVVGIVCIYLHLIVATGAEARGLNGYKVLLVSDGSEVTAGDASLGHAHQIRRDDVADVVHVRTSN